MLSVEERAKSERRTEACEGVMPVEIGPGEETGGIVHAPLMVQLRIHLVHNFDLEYPATWSESLSHMEPFMGMIQRVEASKMH